MEVYDLRKLPEEGDVVEEALAVEWLNEHLNDEYATEDLALEAKEPGRVRLQLQRIDSEDTPDVIVHVHGTIAVKLSTRCVRCLSEIDLALESEVDQTLFPAQAQASDEDEEESARGKHRVELKRDELEDGQYVDQEIDLPAIVREAILLDVAMNPCCEDEIACRERTAELITSASNGSQEEASDVDPRWADLLKFKLKSS